MDRARVSSRGAARWARGHPWIYRSDVLEPPRGEAGAVRVESEAGGLVGTALWSPASTISLRMLSSEDRAPDAAFWSGRLRAALRYRERLGLGADGETTAYRLVHAEADGLPSLVVDRYGEYLVVQLLSAGLEAFREEIVEALQTTLAPAGILARNDVPVRQYERLPRESELLNGDVPAQVEVSEAGARYRADLWEGQKTGAFLDQRENRVRGGALARGRALDCFAYHGSFALHLARQAEEVVAVDSSGPALERAASNAAVNGLDNIRTVQANVFEFLRAQEEERGRWDIIVLDPPAFAKRKDALKRALAGYKEINLRALRILAEGGHLCTFSCSYHVNRASFRAMLEDAAADAGRPVRWVEARGQSADHPEILQIPESGYLKGAVLEVE